MPVDRMKKATIIIPAYNEEKRIRDTLEEYFKFFKKIKKDKELDFEIIVSLNGCKDKTSEIVKDIKKKRKASEIRIIEIKESGKGLAIINGFKDALSRNSDFIGYVDADMATKPEEYYNLIKQIGNGDGVIASRYLKGAKVNPKPSIQRIFASRIFNKLIRLILFLKYKDTQCGAKIFTRKAIEKVVPLLSLSQLAFDVDLLFNLKKLGFKVREVPTVWSDKGYSTVNFMKSGPKMALAIIRLRILNSWFKDFMGLYNKLNKKVTKKKNQEIKIGFAGSAGGHLSQIEKIFDEGVLEKRKRIYLTEKNSKTIEKSKKERIYFFKPLGYNPFNYIPAIIRCLRIFLKEKVNLVITTGAEIGLVSVIAGRLIGAKTVFIDTVIRVKIPTLAGKLSYGFSDIFLVQNPDMEKHYGPRARYVGGVI
jgi:glycosyltransferase involved in cell wall biosynthesis